MPVTHGNSLQGRCILLSASVPDTERDHRFRQIDDAAFQIEQAVVSLARAVFSAGGRLVFGGHPSISPLVSIVAGEYRPPVRAESREERPPAQVIIYQSEILRDVIPGDSRLLIDLGLAKACWVPADPKERFVMGGGPLAEQCPQSLYEMRQRMIEDNSPIAMVCIGGMEGVLAEAALYAGHGPIFTLARTGGAAALLAQENPDVKAIDNEIMALLSDVDGGWSKDDAVASHHRRFREGDIAVMPYPLIMQTIVEQLLGELS
ncbi:hypothetical protein [Sphingobium yanoikuyae]|uniref:SLOG domain-containing protein n=1 Tax=Sphingobium yanoikuyae TaxID=13690 RepID=UPI0022DDC7C2|nr:hypothetical protein [Sphingobium yanoikuyae]WBQ16782.1 hypothetical protein PAE53_00860 [Sphingobium yanoikuyae]